MTLPRASDIGSISRLVPRRRAQGGNLTCEVSAGLVDGSVY